MVFVCDVTDLEAPEGPVVTVQHKHRQRGELSCSVPAVTAVDQHGIPTGHLVGHLDGSGQDQLQRRQVRHG